jgi:hypothetical protein
MVYFVQSGLRVQGEAGIQKQARRSRSLSFLGQTLARSESVLMGRGLAVRSGCREDRRGQGDRGINSERSERFMPRKPLDRIAGLSGNMNGPEASPCLIKTLTDGIGHGKAAVGFVVTNGPGLAHGSVTIQA